MCILSHTPYLCPEGQASKNVGHFQYNSEHIFVNVFSCYCVSLPSKKILLIINSSKNMCIDYKFSIAWVSFMLIMLLGIGRVELSQAAIFRIEEHRTSPMYWRELEVRMTPIGHSHGGLLNGWFYDHHRSFQKTKLTHIFSTSYIASVFRLFNDLNLQDNLI